MPNVNVSDLRARLPDYLARAARGETVRVTVRGRAIAQIVRSTTNDDGANAARARLRGSLLRYEEPFEPAFDPAEWNMEKETSGQ